MLDKDWMAVNPANPKQIAVTYTDFDVSETICPSSLRTGIELVASFDGGTTWSSPQVVYTACASSPASVQGSQVAFSPSGAVNVAFQLSTFGFFFTSEEIEFARALSLGGVFGATVAVANATPVGDGIALQGGFRSGPYLQGMAVDRSDRLTHGNIYIVYHDASDYRRPFPEATYGYADVMITKSTNNGATWSVPVEVNTNSDFGSSVGTDSFMPGVAVDNTSGEVGVCWYDRRNDPVNFAVDRYCGDSFDAGATFTNVRMTPSSFSPIHGIDNLVNPVYMGDYDTVASDFLKTTSGFIGAFQVVSGAAGTSLVPNSNVKARNFK
jgi:hypothetical protein